MKAAIGIAVLAVLLSVIAVGAQTASGAIGGYIREVPPEIAKKEVRFCERPEEKPEFLKRAAAVELLWKAMEARQIMDKKLKELQQEQGK